MVSCQLRSDRAEEGRPCCELEYAQKEKKQKYMVWSWRKPDCKNFSRKQSRHQKSFWVKEGFRNVLLI